MKPITIIVVFLLVLSSCTFNTAPLSGRYVEQTAWTNSTRPYDELFDRAIDILTDEGHIPEYIDKGTGVIRFKAVLPFYQIATERKGQPDKPERFAVAVPNLLISVLNSNIIILVRPSAVGVRLIIDKRAEARSISGQIASLGVYEADLAKKIAQ